MKTLGLPCPCTISSRLTRLIVSRSLTITWGESPRPVFCPSSRLTNMNPTILRSHSSQSTPCNLTISTLMHLRTPISTKLSLTSQASLPWEICKWNHRRSSIRNLCKSSTSISIIEISPSYRCHHNNNIPTSPCIKIKWHYHSSSLL